ncbi:MAG: DNA gyrase inhibitor YacG [Gammaproteobacteria bacterium]|nr:DNA gyrase inhibitor YacG [Gammaproteobacteria bacterium]
MKKLIIKCPTCSTKHDYYQSKPWSPFCSERCRLIDLGAWAGEEHRIKGESIPVSDQPMNKTDDDNSGNFIN